MDGPTEIHAGLRVVRGHPPVIQVGHELRVAGVEHFLGNLQTGLEGIVRQRDLTGTAPKRELQAHAGGWRA